MGRNALIIAAAVLCSAAVSGFVAYQVAGDGEKTTSAAPATVEDKQDDELIELRQRIELMESAPRFDAELTARVAKLEDRFGDAGPTVPAAEPTEVKPTAVVLLPAEAANMTPEELAYQGRIMMGRRDYGTALAYWEKVLDGNPDEERSNEALYQTGLSYRMLKDHEKEEKAFRNWAAAQEPDSSGEMSALFQVSWSLYYQKKYDDALDVMEKVARGKNTHEATRPYAMFQTANFAFNTGNYARARPYLVQVLEEFGSSTDQNHAWMIRQAKALLKKVDGG